MPDVLTSGTLDATIPRDVAPSEAAIKLKVPEKL
jgi:hypothetical protein